MTHLTIVRPDDWHVHLRDGAMLPDTVGAMSRYFGRAIVMPNLVPPARTTAEAGAYRERILAARPKGSRFEPLMVLYLTDSTTPADIQTLARQYLRSEAAWKAVVVSSNAPAAQ